MSRSRGDLPALRARAPVACGFLLLAACSSSETPETVTVDDNQLWFGVVFDGPSIRQVVGPVRDGAVYVEGEEGNELILVGIARAAPI